MARDTSLTYSLYGKDVSASKAMKNVGDQVKKVGVAFAAAGALAAKFAYDAVQSASDLAETQSKVGVIFGKNAGAIQKFAESAAKSLGQSKQQAMDAAANFAIFGKAAGMRGKDLVDFSTNLTKTAADMASFANTTPQEAIDALGSALRGEMEPIRKYGVLLDQETLKNRGTIMGFGKEIGNSLTGGQKVMFATAEIMEQLGKRGSDTLGDFARTSDGLANKQRILAASFQNTKTDIGEALLPIMQKLADYLVKTVVPNLQSFVGVFTGDKGINSALHDGTIEAHNFGLKVKKIGEWVVDHKDDILKFGKAIAAIFVGIKVGGVVSALTTLAAAFIPVTAAAATAAGAEAAATGGTSLLAAAPAIAAIAAAFGVAGLTGLIGVGGDTGPAVTTTESYTAQEKAGKAAAKRKRAAELPDTMANTYIHNGTTYNWDKERKQWWVLATGNEGTYRDYSTPHPEGAPRAVGGSVVRGLRYTVGERGPETFTPTTTGRITPHGLGSTGGVGVVVNVHGSVIHERDLAISVRDQIAQLMRRRGLDPAILGV